MVDLLPEAANECATDQVQHGLVVDGLDLVLRVVIDQVLLELLSAIQVLETDIARVLVTTLDSSAS